MDFNTSITELQSLMHPCPDLESTWLLVHFYYTCLLSIYLGMVILPLYAVFIVIWVLYWCRYYLEAPLIPTEEGTLEEIIRRHRVMFLKRETTTAAIYVLIASVCMWLFDIGPINSMRLTRLTIEAFCCPWMLSITIVADYFDLIIGETTESNPALLTPGLYLLKFFQLVVMRYAELFPASRLNDLQTLLFYHLCSASGAHRIPADHPMKPFLRRLKRLI